MNRAYWRITAAGLLVLAGILFSFLQSPLLAHVLIEFLCIAIAWCIFVFLWNSRIFLDNSYLLVLGVGYLIAGGFDLAHVLANEGIGVLPAAGRNASLQFWVIGRTIEGISFIAVPLLVSRRIPIATMLGTFALLTGALLGSQAGGIFPTCFVEGAGPTVFRTISELTIAVVFAGSLPLLFAHRRQLGESVVAFLIGSAVFTIASQLVLVSSPGINSAWDLIGRDLKFVSYYLIYRAIIMMGFIDPYHLLFRNLQQARESERSARERAERKAAELEALRANFADIVAQLELPKLLQAILERAVALLNATGGDLGLFERERNELRIVASYNMGSDYIGTRIRLGEGAMGTAAKTREPVIIRNYSAWHGRSPHYHQFHWHTFMALPLSVRGRLFGTLGIVESDPQRDFIASDLNLIMLFAQQAAIAIENAQLYEEARHQAETDGLTGLANRRHFFELARTEVNRALRYGHSLSAIMFDLDHFKHVNDTYGHAVGDQVLVAIAQLCRKHFRETDVIGRYGGEEFVLLLPETGLQTAAEAGERLRRKIVRETIAVDSAEFCVSVSLGLAEFDRSDADLDKLLICADKALYAAKQAGGNSLFIWKSGSAGRMLEAPAVAS